jgi:ArsR family transcriptional regulator, arsenate/arsenite/antimonite-responsive transcriptional repressor / arsenate reductase (thioredoxin)
MREEHGLDLASHRSKHVDAFVGRRFDWVISLCDRVREVCPQFPRQPETIHWSIANPAAGDADDDDTYPLFQETAAELETRIGFLLAVVGERSSARRRIKEKS